MTVRSTITESRGNVPRRKLTHLTRRVIAGEGGDLDVSLIFTGDRLLRQLNRRYRKKDRTTDVLSFHVPGVKGLNPDSCEIYISLPQASRQARSLGHSLESELERLVVHGTLHLLGFDHHKANEARLMRQREQHYLGLGT